MIPPGANKGRYDRYAKVLNPNPSPKIKEPSLRPRWTGAGDSDHLKQRGYHGAIELDLDLSPVVGQGWRTNNPETKGLGRK